MAFVSALEFHTAKLPGGSPKSLPAVAAVGERPDAPTKRGLRASGNSRLLFFSMEDGEFVGSVPSHLCGENVEVLQLSAESMVGQIRRRARSVSCFKSVPVQLQAVGCGDHAGANFPQSFAAAERLSAAQALSVCFRLPGRRRTQQLPGSKSRRPRACDSKLATSQSPRLPTAPKFPLKPQL